MPLVEGRDVSHDDLRAGEPTVVINETFARRYFPGGGALGRRIVLETAPGVSATPARIVGIVRDSRHVPPPAELPPTAYMIQPRQTPSQTFVLQTTLSDPTVLGSSIRHAVRQLDPSVIVQRIQTQSRVVKRTFWRQALQRDVSTIFAGLALLLAVLGMYGVLSYAVGQRTSELGIRLALGASPAALLMMMLSQAARLALVGIVVGVAASLALGRLISGMLYGVGATDPMTLAAVAMTLFVIALAAGLRPALRAARLDAQITMHES